MLNLQEKAVPLCLQALVTFPHARVSPELSSALSTTEIQFLPAVFFSLLKYCIDAKATFPTLLYCTKARK